MLKDLIRPGSTVTETLQIDSSIVWKKDFAGALQNIDVFVMSRRLKWVSSGLEGKPPQTFNQVSGYFLILMYIYTNSVPTLYDVYTLNSRGK